MFDALDPYSHALAALAIWAIVVPVLGAMSTVGRSPEGRSPCGKPTRNYADPVYRRERAFMNAIETSGPFIAATLAAVLTGAPAFWVNLFASLFLVLRVGMAYFHIATENQAARSAFFASALLCVLCLAMLGVWGAFT
ncbi:MAG: MAPEG family protein [Pseudomonadota bacterium]